MRRARRDPAPRPRRTDRRRAAPAGSWGLRRPALDRPVAVRPVLERAVVQAHREADGARGEEHGGRLLADVAVADDRVAGLHSCVAEQLGEFGRRLEDVAVVYDLSERDAPGPGDMAVAACIPGTAFHDAVIETRGAGVHEIVSGGLRVGPNPPTAPHHRPN